MGGLLWTVIVILFVLWLIGFIADFGGGLIHLILVVAGIIFIIQLLLGNRGV
ncbi:MAG TPA: lmo0937 family membrane protein [Pseudogracilibacillus sp.]|nr:lmo0937 family membrane protein [Pseudogracilibacillus sp.]